MTKKKILQFVDSRTPASILQRPLDRNCHSERRCSPRADFDRDGGFSPPGYELKQFHKVTVVSPASARGLVELVLQKIKYMFLYHYLIKANSLTNCW